MVGALRWPTRPLIPIEAGLFFTQRVAFNKQVRCQKSRQTGRRPRLRHSLGDTARQSANIRHDVVALARQAEQLINSGDAVAIDRAAIQTDMSALGRFLITKKEADSASFKTPNLRNVLVTGPYFHDGSQETLWDVIDHYNKGDGLQNPFLDEDIQPLALTESDIDDLVAFLASLTSADYSEEGINELARQRDISRTKRPQRDTARAFGPKPPRPMLPRP
jgi:cytochrome c peroxidase